MKDFNKLRFLLFQEVYFRVLAKLQSVDKTRVLDKAAAVECLNFKCCCQFATLLPFVLPVAVHVAEDDASVVSALNLLCRKKQVFVMGVG